MLRARREHPIRLEAALRDEVIDQNADVRFISPKHHRIFSANRSRGVDAGH